MYLFHWKHDYVITGITFSKITTSICYSIGTGLRQTSRVQLKDQHQNLHIFKIHGVGTSHSRNRELRSCWNYSLGNVSAILSVDSSTCDETVFSTHFYTSWWLLTITLLSLWYLHGSLFVLMAPAFSYLPSHPIMLRLFLAIFKILLFNPTNSQGWVAIGIMAILVRHLEVYLQFSLYTNVTNLLYTSYLVPYIQIYTKSFFLTRFISSIPASCPQSRTHRRFSTEKQAFFLSLNYCL